MATVVIIPASGQKDARGTIGMWFKSEGETVAKGEPLCTVETEKASVEIEAPSSGVLRRILVPRDTEVAVGDWIAIIGGAGEDIRSLEEEFAARQGKG